VERFAEWELDLGRALKRYAASAASIVGRTPPEHMKPFPSLRQVEFQPEHPLRFDRPRGVSSATAFLLGRSDFSDVVARRRSHYAQLLEAFADRVPPPFRTLTREASPLVFPIEQRTGRCCQTDCAGKGLRRGRGGRSCIHPFQRRDFHEPSHGISGSSWSRCIRICDHKTSIECERRYFTCSQSWS
jgi:hypothetical protein